MFPHLETKRHCEFANIFKRIQAHTQTPITFRSLITLTTLQSVGDYNQSSYDHQFAVFISEEQRCHAASVSSAVLMDISERLQADLSGPQGGVSVGQVEGE